jgi:hypothetical protein
MSEPVLGRLRDATFRRRSLASVDDSSNNNAAARVITGIQ